MVTFFPYLYSCRRSWCSKLGGINPKKSSQATLKTEVKTLVKKGIQCTMILKKHGFFKNQNNFLTLKSIRCCCCCCCCHRPLALRGHVTNVSFKQWVGILLMPKIDGGHKKYHLTPEIWEETHLREIFYGALIFQQSSMICIGRHVEGHTLALQDGDQNYFTFRYAQNFTTSSFQQFPWIRCKISVQKEVIHSTGGPDVVCVKWIY